MIEFRPFVSFVIANCEDKFRRHDITVDTADTDLDLIAAGILDSFDLLNLAMALEDQHRLTMDFSVFTSDFDASFKGLYSCLTPEAGAPEPSPPPMPDTILAPIMDALVRAGVSTGDRIFLHSSALTLGLSRLDCADLLERLLAAIGPQGSIFAPAANVQAFQSGNFDIDNTPAHADFGWLSEAIRQHAGASRSQNPFDSVAGLGPDAAQVCQGLEADCYGPQSPWSRLLGKDVKLIMLGIDFHYASIVHLAELQCQVPYRGWKEFFGKIRVNGAFKDVTLRLFAAEMNTQRFYQKIADLPEMAGRFKTLDIKGGGYVASLDDVFNACCAAMRRAPRIFVEP